MGSWKRPNPRLLISEGALRPPGGGCDAHRCLRNHHFVRRVEVFYPDAADGSNAADGNEAGPKGAFTIAEVGISGILEHGFAEKYVRIGGLYMMAADQMVERWVLLLHGHDHYPVHVALRSGMPLQAQYCVCGSRRPSHVY